MAKIIGKISGKTFRPERLFALAATEQSMVLGTLIGVAKAFKIVTSPDGDETFQGYAGTFQFFDVDPAIEPIASGVLYLPAGINEMLQEAGNVAFKDGGMVKIALEVLAERADNPAKRSWAFNQLEAEVEKPTDALADLMKHLPASRRPAAIENKGDATSAGDAVPEADKAPAKSGKAA